MLTDRQKTDSQLPRGAPKSLRFDDIVIKDPKQKKKK
jgi:hypothetical protein